MPDVTFSFTTAQLDRLKSMVGHKIHADHSPATNTEAKQWQINEWKNHVRDHERAVAIAAINLGSDLDVT